MEERKPRWLYDEGKHAGMDYTETSNAEAYSGKVASVRDVSAENDEIISRIKRPGFRAVVDVGCGTGEFSIAASSSFERVHAVDISRAMIDIARRKANSLGIENITFHNSGFLTYEHEGDPPDAIVTQFALHHLPDFWKSVALRRMASMMRPGGLLFIRDISYSFDPYRYQSFLDGLLAHAEKIGGASFANDIEVSVKSEYVTMSWILERIIEESGFSIEEKKYENPFTAAYLCKKKD